MSGRLDFSVNTIEAFLDRAITVWPIGAAKVGEAVVGFYPAVSDESEVSHVALPVGFYANEFLEADFASLEGLVAFQKQYGVLQGARMAPSMYQLEDEEKFRPMPNPYLFTDVFRERYERQYQGILISRRWYDERSGDQEFLRFVTSIDEAQAAALDAQNGIRTVTGLMTDDAEVSDAARLEAWMAVRLAAAVVADVVPLVDVSIPDNEHYPYCSVLQMVYAQFLRGITFNGNYRRCRNRMCQRLFTPKEMGRAADSAFCSRGCQIREKNLRAKDRREGK